MDGYVIKLQADEENSPAIYWTETESAMEDLNQANLYPSVTEARLAAGRIQASYTSHLVEVLPASKGITLKSPNVATSFTN